MPLVLIGDHERHFGPPPAAQSDIIAEADDYLIGFLTLNGQQAVALLRIIDAEFLHKTPRNLRHTYVLPVEDKRTWRVQQMLVDPDEHNDWVAEFEVDLPASRAKGEPVMALRKLGAL